MQPRLAGWIAKACATVCTGSTRTGLRAFTTSTPGAVPKLTAAEKAELAALVEVGPDPQVDGVVRWRRIDLKEVIRDRFGVDYHERSVSRLLHELGFSHMSARPRHPGQDPEMLETYKKISPGRSPRR